MQFAVRFMPQRLRATAQIASLCVETDFPAQTGPPVASQNQFKSFESPRMSHDMRVAMLLDNPSPKVFVFWDVDLAGHDLRGPILRFKLTLERETSGVHVLRWRLALRD